MNTDIDNLKNEMEYVATHMPSKEKRRNDCLFTTWVIGEIKRETGQDPMFITTDPRFREMIMHKSENPDAIAYKARFDAWLANETKPRLVEVLAKQFPNGSNAPVKIGNACDFMKLWEGTMDKIPEDILNRELVRFDEANDEYCACYYVIKD